MRVLASGFLLLRLAGSRAAFLLLCGFWLSAADTLRLCSKYFGRAAGGGQNVLTAAQQGAAPDRLQLRSLRSFLASVSALPAAGELNRCVAAPGAMREGGSTLAADMSRRESIFGGVGCVGGRGLVALARRLAFEGKTNQQQHNKALHPTARSVVVFPALSLC